MLKLEAVLGVVVFCLWVYCLLDVIRTDEGSARHLGKVWWLLLVLLFPLVGSVAWLVAGRPRQERRSAYERAVPDFPEYDRPGRAAATDGAADEDFLRQVRERAEEQRRRHREERLRREREQRGET